MPNRSTILYICAWLVYVLFSFTMFPVLNISAAIPVIFLVSIGAWPYGTTTALGISVAIVAHHLIGYRLKQIAAELTSYLKNGYEQIEIIVSKPCPDISEAPQ